MATFRILSIDGGGIRGLIPAIWLAQLEDDLREEGSSLQSSFDLICGTSTGSILAAAIATGISMHQIVGLFEDDGPRIFKRRSSFFFPTQMRNAKVARYPSHALQKALQSELGNRQLHDANPDLCITAYDIENRRTILFRSYDKSTRDVHIWEACLASSSAPTYFSPAKVNIGRSRHIVVDGGVVANNPSALAIAEAISIKRKKRLTPDLDLSIISLGTGSSTRNLAPRGNSPQGWFDWAVPILDVMFDGSSSISDHISKQILDPTKYVRMQFEMIRGSGSDDLDNVADYNLDALKASARSYMNNDGVEIYKRALDMMIKSKARPKPATPGNMPAPD
ncbi:MAG: patatin-like phospholipase family protein [Gammaproteobacteria bacterium]|nr:patatin-like phospholipase family protein [Gammaproteobacteria bacterium]